MNSFVCGVALLAYLLAGSYRAQAAAPGSSGLIALPSLPGAETSDAFAVNDAGTIVGFSGDHPVRWVDGQITALDGPFIFVLDGTPQQAAYTTAVAVDINASGQIVGDLFVAGKGPYVALWDESAWAWRALPVPGNERASARGINDRGDVAGHAFGHAAVWREGALELLPRIGTFCRAYAINNAGSVTGFCYGELPVTPWEFTVAVRWDGGVPTALDGLGFDAYGRDINNGGLVVGHDSHGDIDQNAPPSGAAAVWQRRLAPAQTVLAPVGSGNGVNERGQIAGFVGVNGGAASAAFWASAWSAPVLYAPLEGDSSAWFRGISNTGWLVGHSSNHDDIQVGRSVAVYTRH